MDTLQSVSRKVDSSNIIAGQNFEVLSWQKVQQNSPVTTTYLISLLHFTQLSPFQTPLKSIICSLKFVMIKSQMKNSLSLKQSIVRFTEPFSTSRNTKVHLRGEDFLPSFHRSAHKERLKELGKGSGISHQSGCGNDQAVPSENTRGSGTKGNQMPLKHI